MYLKIEFADIAEAPYKGPYVSMTYMVAAIKMNNWPMLKNTSAMIGTIQWTDGLAVHPNMNSAIGMSKLPVRLLLVERVCLPSEY